MSTFLEWLQNTAVGTWVTQSPAGFYILLSFHAVGMAMVVGIMMMVCLRVLGVASKISPAALPKLVTFSWVGFWINFFSGLLMFIGEGHKMFYNWSYRWKMLFVVVGMITTYVMTKNTLKPAAAGDGSALNTQNAKFQAVFLILVWLGVIFAGRWTAYIGQIEGTG